MQSNWSRTDRCTAVVVELTDAEAVAAGNSRCRQAQLGEIDILVNNAGIAGPTEPSWEYALEDWRRVSSMSTSMPCITAVRAVVPQNARTGLRPHRQRRRQ